MMLLMAAALAATLVAAGPPPAAGGPPLLPVTSGARVGLTAAGDFAATKDAYLRRAEAELQAWRRRVYALGEGAGAEGRKIGDAAANGLRTAWAEAETGWGELRAASDTGWASARTSFEQAVADLKSVWHSIHPRDN